MSPKNLPDHTQFGLSVVVVGNDALIEALPARPIQFAHACRAAGFDMALPASWGDELLAEATLRKLETINGRPAVLCACPIVRQRLLASGEELAPLILPTVAPPVAAGRYVRALLGPRLAFLAYVGNCPSANDKVYDAHYSAAEFLGYLRDQRIDLLQQPEIFEAVLPPDRRRHVSLPGGCPTAEALALRSHERSLVSLEGDDIALELAQHLLTRQPVLVDLAPALGCACSGVTARTLGSSARVAVMSLEPPRAMSSVVDLSLVSSLDAPVERSVEASPEAVNPAEASGGAHDTAIAEETLAQSQSEALDSSPTGRTQRPRYAVTPPAALPVSDIELKTPPGDGFRNEPSAQQARPVTGLEATPTPAPYGRLGLTRRPPASSVTYVTRTTPGGFPRIALERRPEEHLPRAYVARRPAHRRSDVEHSGAVPDTAAPVVEREIPVSVVVETPPGAAPVPGSSPSSLREPLTVPRGGPVFSSSSSARDRMRTPVTSRPLRREATRPARDRRHVRWIAARRILLVLVLVALALLALRLLAS